MGYSWNTLYLLHNGSPWLPVMGEIHYSRFREEFWEESLRKMKAGGIEIVSTYVIWIHHEEIEGKFDFSGCRDLGKFLRLCAKLELKVFLRMGPWAHAEVRNGGFPDWLVQKGIPLRCNGESYLRYVKRFWSMVYEQVDGMLEKDGGPVIGIQIENEYGHTGGLRGAAGETHMRTLAEIARKVGFLVPFYTATSWGNSITGGLLPVMQSYCEAPWDPRRKELEANPNFVFIDIEKRGFPGTKTTGSRTGVREVPYLLAELGGGVQPTHHRRPVTTAKDIGAMSIVHIGSGAGLLGYYMYHGGSNPKGKSTPLQESRDTGFPSDLPVINYDFNAPIRQYGQISDAYREVRLLAMFLKDFGEDLAQLKPEVSPVGVRPENTQTLRTAWRHDETHGYVFFNNYQRNKVMEEQGCVCLMGKCAEPVEFPSITISNGCYGFFPYHMKLGNAELLCAAATPLCRIAGTEDTWVFYGDWEPRFQWKGGKAASVLHLTRQQALEACKVKLDREYLLLSPGYVWEENGKLKITGGKDTMLKSFPALSHLPQGFVPAGTQGVFTCYRRTMTQENSTLSFRLISEQQEEKLYELSVEYGEGIEDCMIQIDYVGDSLEVLLGGELINDHFYTGQPLEISAKYFDFPKKLRVRIHPLYKNSRWFLESWPEFTGKCACKMMAVTVEDEYR